MDQHFIPSFIGEIIAFGGGGIALGFGLFKWFGQRWLDDHFKHKLEAFKGEQARQLAELQAKLNAVLARQTHLQQKDVEVLEELWSRLTDAFHITKAFSFPITEVSNLDKMGEAQFKEYVEGSPLAKWQKDELLGITSDKTRYYSNAIFWHQLNDVNVRYRELHSYLLKNGIFLQESIEKEFSEIDDLIWNALNERKREHQRPNSSIDTNDWQILASAQNGKLKNLQKAVRERVWDASLRDINSKPPAQ